MPDYKPAPDEIVELAQELIELYHPHLADARIGLLLRADPVRSNGRTVLGAARKAPAELRVYADFDFIIWLAEEWWRQILTPHQRRALLDHELCHCYRDLGGDTRMVGHDFEEFNVIIRRYGFWRPFGDATEEAIQARLGLESQRGCVAPVDVIEQVGMLLDGDEAEGRDS